MDTALKQRLIGASVLIALAVIFLPMLIKGPAPESGASDVPLNLPEAPQGEFETRELPLVTPGASAAAPAPVTGTPVPTQPATGTVAPASNAMSAATAAGQYAVGFGSYATADDAGRVVAALRASQLPGYQEPVPADGGRTLHRVRIGPYATQAEAESARLRAAHVSDRVNAKVVVLDAPGAASPAASATAPAASQPAAMPAAPATTTAALPETRPAPAAATAPQPGAKPAVSTATAAPAPAKPAPAPAEPRPAASPAAASVGFAVQLGAFASADEAGRLRDRARAAGFSAFVEQVNTDKGTLSRVRIGPVADRTEADRLRAQVASSLGVAGIVRPHP